MAVSGAAPWGRGAGVAVLGAGWDRGLCAGAFCWSLCYASSYRGRNISSQLVNALTSPRQKWRGVFIRITMY